MLEFDRTAVGTVVRRLRKERKLSQDVLSGLAGLARSHLAMIENGSKQANVETLWRIANALDLPPHQLILQIEQEIESRQKEKGT